MKRTILATTAILSLVSGFEVYATETKEDSHCAVTALNPSGDERIKRVTFCDGYSIPLVAARGQSLPIEMPAGWVVRTIMPSEEDVMKSIMRPGQDSGASGRNPDDVGSPMRQQSEAQAAAQRGDNGCKKNANIVYCIKRDRFIYLMPISTLSSQTLPVIMVEMKGDKEIEHNVIFDLSTVGKQYFSLRVFPPQASVSRQSAAPANPARVGNAQRQPPPVAARRPLGCPPSGCLHNTQPQNLAAPPQANSSYVIQGDRSLIGGGR